MHADSAPLTTAKVPPRRVRTDMWANMPLSAMPSDVLLTSGTVKARLGHCSDMAIWRWSRDEAIRFPAPDLTIGQRRFWYVKTVLAFMARMAAAPATTEEHGVAGTDALTL